MNGLSILGSLLAVVHCGGCNKFPDSTNTTTINPGRTCCRATTVADNEALVGPEEMVVELALNAEQQRTGMMFWTNLAGFAQALEDGEILVVLDRITQCLEADGAQDAVVTEGMRGIDQRAFGS